MKRLVMKKILFLLICLTLLAVSYSCGKQANPGPLFPIVQNDKWGYIDKTGKIAIKPQFDYVQGFREGLAKVRIGDFVTGKSGYIDKTGKIVIEPRFANASSFSEGLAFVGTRDKDTFDYGYIDKAGRIVIKLQGFGDGIADFSGGLIPVYVDGKRGYMNKKGEIVIKPQFRRSDDFSEGLAKVKIGDKYGYIDKTGDVIIEPQFVLADRFSEGLARVNIGAVWGGNPNTIATIDGISIHVDTPITRTCGKWGYIDMKGKMVIEPQFDGVNDFSEGLARVNIGGKWNGYYLVGGKYGYIDQTGKLVIQPQFDWADNFSNGLACINIGCEPSDGHSFVGGKTGYIDKTGKYVWKPSK